MLPLKSKVTIRTLEYLFIHKDKSFYVNQLVRKLNLDKRNLVKKLKELEQENLLQSKKESNLKYYSINKSYPLYQEYKNIFTKNFGPEGKLKNILKRTRGIKEAYIYGNYPNNKSCKTINILVIGNHSSIALQNKINKLQNKLDIKINTANISHKEFLYKNKKKNLFIENVLNKKHIKLL